METISVHGAPSEYILKAGILKDLESKLLERGFQNVLFVHGEKSWQAAKPFLPVFNKVVFEEYAYHGECSLSEIAELSTIVKEGTYDAIIGVGGGKVLDLVKAVCHFTHKHSVLIPTLASNCSPWTPISVIYDESGAFIRFEVYPISTSLLLVEPKILVNSPIEMLIAGIGDTLAKWYEADVQMASIMNKSVPLLISYYTAKQCKDLLVKHAEEAVNAAKNEEINDDYIKIVETIIMLGGMVGGFGDHYGRVAGAHAIHNGLTVLKETHRALHGDKVAYGILVQLVLENKWEEIQGLYPFYRKLGLPISLTELGVSIIDNDIINAVSVKSTSLEESIHVMPNGPITSERVSKAISDLEKHISEH